MSVLRSLASPAAPGSHPAAVVMPVQFILGPLRSRHLPRLYPGLLPASEWMKRTRKQQQVDNIH
jgi:hypothetical protein